MNVLSFLLNNLVLDKTTDTLQKVATVDKEYIELAIYKLAESNTLIAKAFTSLVGPKLNILSIGDLSSWSTFILYTITIMLMFFAGGYYINVQQTDDLRWRDKNTYIGLPLALNGYFLIMLIMDILIFKTIFGTMLFGIVSIIVLIYKKITYTRLFLVNFSSYMLIDIIFFVLNDDSDMYIFIGLVFVMNLFINFLIMGFSKEKLYPLKEYLFYLVDEKCYSAKLESITEGFLVLHDVKLYNEEIVDESIDNLKVENFEIEKTIIPRKMIIPKEQVISMYILENNKKNGENQENTKRNYKISKNFIIGFLIFIINITSFVKRTNSNIYKELILSFIISFIGLVLIQILNDFIKNNELKNDFFEINNTLIVDVIIFILNLFFFEKIAQLKISAVIFVVAIDLIYLLIKYLIRKKDNDAIKYDVNKNICMLLLVTILIIVSFMEKERMNYLIIGIPTIFSIMIMYFIYEYKKVG